MNVGFIGIGQMGKHMAKRVLDAGYSLYINDIAREQARELISQGAKWIDTPQEMAKTCQVVITSLPSPQVVEQVVFGQSGLKQGWKKGDIYVDMSTNSPSVVQRISADARQVGVNVLDAPVSGGTKGAEMGTLTIIVGGDPAVLEQVQEILKTMGKNIFHVGEIGCGNVVKLINNMIALSLAELNAEAFVLGTKAGVDPQVLWNVLTVSTANNWVLQQYPNSVFSGSFAPMYRLNLGLKDASLAVQMAKEYGVPLPMGSVAEQKLIEAKAAGLGEKGVDAVIMLLENITGVKVRSQK